MNDVGRRRLVAALLAMGTGGLLLGLQSPRPAFDSGEDVVALGRAVYVSEGCVHCHSQYVRPVGRDRELWGPATAPEVALAQVPVLIGNRRQGPDLANVALRRNRQWNRLHLMSPSLITPGSRMPSYAYLFTGTGQRGEALLSYLDQLKPDASEAENAP